MSDNKAPAPEVQPHWLDTQVPNVLAANGHLHGRLKELLNRVSELEDTVVSLEIENRRLQRINDNYWALLMKGSGA